MPSFGSVDGATTADAGRTCPHQDIARRTGHRPTATAIAKADHTCSVFCYSQSLAVTCAGQGCGAVKNPCRPCAGARASVFTDHVPISVSQAGHAKP